MRRNETEAADEVLVLEADDLVEADAAPAQEHTAVPLRERMVAMQRESRTPAPTPALARTGGAPVDDRDAFLRLATGRHQDEHSLSGLSGFDHPDKLLRRRGWLLILLIAGCLLVVGLCIATHIRHASAKVRAIPSVAFISSDRQTKISRRELRIFAERLTARLNTWSSWNLDGVRQSVLPFFAPERQGQIDERFQKLRQEHGKDQMLSTCFITGSLWGPVENDTIYQIEVYYDLAEGLEKPNRRMEQFRLVRQAVILDVVRAEPTDENEEGLQVIAYREYGEQEYKAKFADDPWSKIRSIKAKP